MSMPKYGEPWAIRTDAIADRVVDRMRGDVLTPPNKARIVACVNACAGLDLPDDVPVGALAELVATAKQVVAAWGIHAKHANT